MRSRRAPTRGLLFALGLSLLLPRAASACDPEGPPPLSFAHPFAEGDPLELLENRASLSCTAEGEGARCQWEARYVVQGKSGGAARSTLTVRVPSQAEGAITVEGAESEPLTAAAEPTDPARPTPDQGTTRLLSTRLSLPASGQAAVVVKAHLAAHGARTSCDDGAIRNRHPLLSGASQKRAFVVQVAPPVGFVSVLPRPSLDVSLPPSWRSEEAHRIWPSWPRQAKWPPPDELVVSKPERLFIHGGPFVGVGLRSGSGLEGRAGWEVAAPVGFIHALAAEGDRERLRFVATTERAVGGYIDSAGLGLGVPIEVRPRVRAGGRAFVSWGLGPVVVLGQLDVLAGGGKASAEAAVFVQGGL